MVRFSETVLDANNAQTNQEVEAMLMAAMRKGTRIDNLSFFTNRANYRRFQRGYMNIMYNCRDRLPGFGPKLAREMAKVGRLYDLDCIFSTERAAEAKRREAEGDAKDRKSLQSL